LTGTNCEEPFFAMSQIIINAIDQGDINPELEGALGVKVHPRKAKSVLNSIQSFAELRERPNKIEKEGCKC
jgi:hypothetical protein